MAKKRIAKKLAAKLEAQRRRRAVNPHAIDPIMRMFRESERQVEEARIERLGRPER